MTPNSMLSVTPAYADTLRRLRPYLQSASPALRELLLVAHGLIADSADSVRLAAEKRRYEESYNYIMNKPIVRAYRALKKVFERLR